LITDEDIVSIIDSQEAEDEDKDQAEAQAEAEAEGDDKEARAHAKARSRKLAYACQCGWPEYHISCSSYREAVPITELITTAPF
jgi:hypothetical protein